MSMEITSRIYGRSDENIRAFRLCDFLVIINSCRSTTPRSCHDLVNLFFQECYNCVRTVSDLKAGWNSSAGIGKPRQSIHDVGGNEQGVTDVLIPGIVSLAIFWISSCCSGVHIEAQN